MGLGEAFDNRTLRAKIGAAVLTATASGLVVGALAITTVHTLNDDAAAAQDKTIEVETAAGAFGKNIEAFSGNLSSLQLHPSLRDRINESVAANKQAITDALRVLGTALGGDPAGAQAVAKAQKDWAAYLAFISADSGATTATPAQLAASVEQYDALYGALGTDEILLQDRATALSAASAAAATSRATGATWIMAGLLGAGVLISLVLGFRVANRVRRAVRGVSHLADGLATGDLTRTSGVLSKDEVGRMAASLDGAIGRLRADVVQLAGNATTCTPRLANSPRPARAQCDHRGGARRRGGARASPWSPARSRTWRRRRPRPPRTSRSAYRPSRPTPAARSTRSGNLRDHPRQHRRHDRRHVRGHPPHHRHRVGHPGGRRRVGQHGRPAADPGVALPLLIEQPARRSPTLRRRSPTALRVGWSPCRAPGQRVAEQRRGRGSDCADHGYRACQYAD